ncbi:hypothetical protein [Dyadobacter sp. 3J3]|uniref:hypothetical protein n=1 Tax=Dyadobacter sp. 3J3 TaxID=2606600 RepID=UPI001356F534|nr:hypothetical protein [Dyadobacter sp. 3J3]
MDKITTIKSVNGCNIDEDKEALDDQAIVGVETDIVTYTKHVDAYKAQIQNGTKNPEAFLRASNFQLAQITKLLDVLDPDAFFLRVYTGVRENGETYQFIMPAKRDGSTMVGLAVDDCCGHPPNKQNFKKDVLLKIP